MKEALTILFLFCHIQLVNAQKYAFQQLNISDSISTLLDKAYGQENVGAGYNVYNLMRRDDFMLRNGIYSFSGMGPHFVRKYFIYKNGAFFFLKTTNIEDSTNLYLDLKECRGKLNLSDSDVTAYYNALKNGPIQKQTLKEKDFNMKSLLGTWYLQTIIDTDCNGIQTCFRVTNENYFFEFSPKHCIIKNDFTSTNNTYSLKNESLSFNCTQLLNIFGFRKNVHLKLKRCFMYNGLQYIELEFKRGSVKRKYVLTKEME